jgi:hypothetical protein
MTSVFDRLIDALSGNIIPPSGESATPRLPFDGNQIISVEVPAYPGDGFNIDPRNPNRQAPGGVNPPDIPQPIASTSQDVSSIMRQWNDYIMANSVGSSRERILDFYSNIQHLSSTGGAIPLPPANNNVSIESSGLLKYLSPSNGGIYQRPSSAQTITAGPGEKITHPDQVDPPADPATPVPPTVPPVPPTATPTDMPIPPIPPKRDLRPLPSTDLKPLPALQIPVVIPEKTFLNEIKRPDPNDIVGPNILTFLKFDDYNLPLDPLAPVDYDRIMSQLDAETIKKIDPLNLDNLFFRPDMIAMMKETTLNHTEEDYNFLLTEKYTIDSYGIETQEPTMFYNDLVGLGGESDELDYSLYF